MYPNLASQVIDIRPSSAISLAELRPVTLAEPAPITLGEPAPITYPGLLHPAEAFALLFDRKSTSGHLQTAIFLGDALPETLSFSVSANSACVTPPQRPFLKASFLAA